MKTISFLFAISWLAFAFFDLNFDSEVFTAYTATERADYEPDDGFPKLLPLAVKYYRIQSGRVVSRVAGQLSVYDDCAIFDRDNWECTFIDESAIFGAAQGEYFTRSNIEKFPSLQYLDEEVSLSRFRYIILQCRWDATGGIDALLCVIRPFTM